MTFIARTLDCMRGAVFLMSCWLPYGAWGIDIATLVNPARPLSIRTNEAGRYIVTWEENRFVRARVVEASVAAPDAVMLLPDWFADRGDFKHSRHASTYQLGRVRLLAAAQRTSLKLPIPDNDIEVAAFDRDLSAIHRRWISLPGIAPHVSDTQIALASDERESACCAMIAYQVRGGRLAVERLDGDGESVGEPIRIPDAGSRGSLFNPAIVYQRQNDHFLLVYETSGDIRARVIGATAGGAAEEIIVATKSRSTPSSVSPDGRPAMAYSHILRAYFVVWLDATSASSRVVRGAFLDEFGRRPTPAFTVSEGCSPSFLIGCLLEPQALDAPAVVDAGQLFFVIFGAHAWAGDEEHSQIAGYLVWHSGSGSPQIRRRWFSPVEDIPSTSASMSYALGAGPGLAAYLQRLSGLGSIHNVKALSASP